MASRVIADNQIRTGLLVAVTGDGYDFSFKFIYENKKVVHKVMFPMSEVINKFNGDLREAVIYYEGSQYLVFKEKIREYLKFREDDNAEIVNANKINRIKNE